MTTTPSPAPAAGPPAMGRSRILVQRAAVVVAAAVVLNVALALLLRAVTGTSGAFMPLQPGPVAIVTLVGVLVGLLVHVLFRRLMARPDRVFAGLVVVGALLSLGGPLSLLGASPADQPGVTDAAALSLVPLHLVPAAAVLVAVLRRSARANALPGAQR